MEGLRNYEMFNSNYCMCASQYKIYIFFLNFLMLVYLPNWFIVKGHDRVRGFGL